MGDDEYVHWLIVVAAGLVCILVVCILVAARRRIPTGLMVVTFPLQLLLTFLIGVMLIYVVECWWDFIVPVLRHQFMA